MPRESYNYLVLVGTMYRIDRRPVLGMNGLRARAREPEAYFNINFIEVRLPILVPAGVDLRIQRGS